MLDVFTIVPSVVVYALDVEGINTFTGPGAAAFAFMRLLRVLRIFRLQHAFVLLSNDVQRQGASLMLTIVASVFIWAGLFQVT